MPNTPELWGPLPWLGPESPAMMELWQGELAWGERTNWGAALPESPAEVEEPQPSEN